MKRSGIIAAAVGLALLIILLWNGPFSRKAMMGRSATTFVRDSLPEIMRNSDVSALRSRATRQFNDTYSEQDNKDMFIRSREEFGPVVSFNSFRFIGVLQLKTSNKTWYVVEAEVTFQNARRPVSAFVVEEDGFWRYDGFLLVPDPH